MMCLRGSMLYISADTIPLGDVDHVVNDMTATAVLPGREAAEYVLSLIPDFSRNLTKAASKHCRPCYSVKVENQLI